VPKPLVIYHGNCADGFTAAWVFWHKFRDALDYHGAAYSRAPPDVCNRVVYIVDFSYKRPIMEELLREAISVVILDHHQSAIEDLSSLEADNFSKIFDINRSGAAIAWDFVFPNEQRPILLNHVQDRDLWKFNLEGTRDFAAALFSYEYDFPLWEKLMGMDPVERLGLRAAGQAIERKHFKDIAELVAVCKRQIVIDGIMVPCCNLPYTMASDAGMLMAEHAPFAACYWDTQKNRVFSLRSAPDGMDVARIAEKYGGGGHKHAAGFSVERSSSLAQA